MRNFALPLAALAMVGATSMAFAAPTTTNGVIKGLDAKAMTITLVDGSVYHFAPTLKVADLKPGAKVVITWDKMGANNQATAIVLSKLHPASERDGGRRQVASALSDAVLSLRRVPGRAPHR